MLKWCLYEVRATKVINCILNVCGVRLYQRFTPSNYTWISMYSKYPFHASIGTFSWIWRKSFRSTRLWNEYIVSDARCAYNLQPIWILDYPRSFHQKPSHSLTHPNLAMASCVSNDNNFETFYICRSSFNLLLPLCSWQYILRWIRANATTSDDKMWFTNFENFHSASNVTRAHAIQLNRVIFVSDSRV